MSSAAQNSQYLGGTFVKIGGYCFFFVREIQMI